ncbi:uncharacterized protein AB675_1291 [Cyphellophora attinorum]|uniref:Major facilitator superfamily (MFS) profile domain-containing protein n=1 Tax=Cyphellophora attinorum TaxID=1664694 RepID=A0A0N1H4K9_9EURO|nr:uncharacterized protein AB675_1291 [Phialophora attinorum]KPI35690.1 hypothetical protein AB675_1291 [Phialophora attinorum]
MALVESLRSQQITGRLIFLLLTATLGPFLFGYHLAELNAPQDVITCKRKSIASSTTSPTLPQCIPMSPLSIGLVSSIYTLGGLFGALSTGTLSATYGRLRPMRAAAIISIIGGLLTAVAPSIAIMSLGRFISGLAAGSATVVVPLYISEIAPPGRKGMLGAMTQIMTCTGIAVTQVLGESPKWLAEHGRAREARGVLQRIRGDSYDIKSETTAWEDGEAAEEEDPEEQGLLTQQTTASSAGKPHLDRNSTENKSILQVLRDPATRPATIAVIAVMTAQQLTGINSIVMYGVTLLASLLASSSALLNIVVSVLNMFVTIACSPLPDRFGRKTMLLVSIAGMGTSSILLGIGIRAPFQYSPQWQRSYSLPPSQQVSDPVQSWALASNWIATFVVAQFFPVVNEALGKGITYFVFAGFGAFFFMWISWYVPETRGKTADEAWGRVGEREE